MVYFPRLVRDGWKHTSQSLELDVFEKPLSNGLTLRKQFHCGRPAAGHGCYWESHVIYDADGKVVVDVANWYWADFDKPRKRVVFAKGGAILALRAANIQGEPKKLHDLNGMKYERILAPY